MPLGTSVIVSEVCQSGDMQVFLHGGRSLTILENLWRCLYWILKTSLSPKDQRELFVPFSKLDYCFNRQEFGSVDNI